jgi:hypothetical protein
MPAIRPISEIADKYKKVTPERAPYYQAGIEKPKRSWAEGATAAAEAYSGGVTIAAREGRYQKGVAAAGDAKWKGNTLVKGVQQGRWSAGVAAFADNYAKGFGPFADTIAATVLPPKYARGDPRNYEKVKAMGDALHRKRIELLK